MRPDVPVRDRLLVLAAPAVLVLVALVAIVRHQTVDQSPWQGIGFGMFSSYDYLPSRTVRATATIGQTARPIEIPNDLQARVDRVRVAPGDSAAVDLADELRRRAGADSVTLEILGHQVDDRRDGFRVTLVPVRTVSVP